jgi:hypothetical protein
LEHVKSPFNSFHFHYSSIILGGYQRNSNKQLNPLQLPHTILQIRYYKAIAAITAAPIIPAPTLKPFPALLVAVAGFEVEEAGVVAGAAVDAVVAEDTEAVADTAVAVADDALEATETADETAEDETEEAVDAEVAVDAAVVALVEAPLARAIEQISLVTLVVAVA